MGTAGATTPAAELAQHEDRVIGSLLGCMCGDALGAQVGVHA